MTQLEHWVQFAGESVALVAALAGFVIAGARRWRAWMEEHVSGPLSDLAECVGDVATAVDDLSQYARYHLGPNGTAPALYRTVETTATLGAALDARLDAIETQNTRRHKNDDHN